MNDTLQMTGEAAERLRVLAAAAAPTAQARPDLARLVLDRTRRQRRFRRLSRVLIGAGAGVAVVSTLAASTLLGRSDFFTVAEPSTAMEPSIRVSEQVVFNKKLVPARGDVVLVHLRDADTGAEYDAILRVAALAGDSIGCPASPSGRCEALVVNGAPFPEPYLGTAVTDPFPTTTVPADTMFLLGDNRSAANDSRYRGPVELDAVDGVAVEIKGANGPARAVPGAPSRTGPGDRDNVDPAGPVPPAGVSVPSSR
ncbi:signal peptidase I [Micromonospora sp. NPDC048930]|uniref:signal peptidase I n=1 Tax=Micromonospora sp. NPDC048930 TaxID=3364261 RepID=UPI00371AD6EF